MGDSISEGTVMKFLKNVGDSVAEDDILVQLETDKVTVDVRIPQSGVVAVLSAKEGETVEVGAPLASIVESGSPEAQRLSGMGNGKQESKKGEEKNVSSSSLSSGSPSAPRQVAKEKPMKASNETPPSSSPSDGAYFGPSGQLERRVPMSRMRQRIAERLKVSQNTYALLTTFNEVDMSEVMQLRSQFKDEFHERHGVRLGFMSAFVCASAAALRDQPIVNAVIDDKDVVYRDYVDISVAVSSANGLVVPVLRNCQDMGFADVEREIARLGKKAQKGALSIAEMQGGTFTISNGGVFGSLLGTPIVNPPQSAILGMHAIQKRPIAVGDQVVIRPMMYVALTYDHRLVDGREAVLFLRKIKQLIENPKKLLLGL
jgi:2-oxoglutarate dehydrogenase E2 component (dihydrolipoamide succinyltransferase)